MNENGINECRLKKKNAVYSQDNRNNTLRIQADPVNVRISVECFNEMRDCGYNQVIPLMHTYSVKDNLKANIHLSNVLTVLSLIHRKCTN